MVVIWARFGPYHLARLEAARKFLGGKGTTVYGVEVARTDSTYDWKVRETSADLQRITLFKEKDYNDLARGEIAAAVTDALESMRPDGVAIVGWAFPEARAALRWCKRHRRGAILMSESKKDDAPRWWHREWVKKLIVSRFDAALVGGTPHRDYVIDLGMPRDRVFLGYDVVDNGYFESETRRIRQNADLLRAELGLPGRFFLACSRFIPKKNLGRLIRAYARYRTLVDTPWGLVICGDGQLAEDLHSLARNVGVNGIRWPGFVQIGDLPKYYGLASAFILPSATEQWGLVVNEAMASGLPVLVSERAGCRYDLVRDGENGYLFDPHDVEDMAGAMLRMAQLPESKRLAMGKRSREIISEWGPDRFAMGLWQAYQAAWSAGHASLSIASKLSLGILTHPLLCARKE